MKKRSASQSAFFYLRASIGMLLVLFGVSLALLGIGQFSAQAQQKNNNAATTSRNPFIPALVDCSQLRALGVHMQENLLAGATMIYCGEAEGGSADPDSGPSSFVQELLAPLLGTADVDLVTGAESSPNITQSETFAAANPDNPDEIVVAYNDSRGVFASPINISGASVSTDGGNTFTRLTKTDGQSPFSNTFGDPVILYNRPTATWYTVWLDAACGGQGLGGYKSTNPSDPNSWTHYTCVHNNFADDRESGWADNNPSSPFYGRMYVSWNDFALGGNLKVRYSTDNGATWNNERELAPATPFIRNVQITGDSATGAVYVAGMNEMNGGLTTRANLFYKSTDGGNTWTNTYTGPTFPAPGRTTCPNSYFACMYPDTGGYWRHMGWGQPAALNGLVHYVYDSRNTGNGDPADVFYIRSTDGGVTFGPPVQLNTDTTTRAQWQPNLSVSPTGTLLAVWYDERETTNCSKGNAGVPCYRMWARKSLDNGATWLPDEPFSDVVTPLPGQPDPGIIAEYAGDYDYSFSVLTQHIHPWADGRIAISGQSQQDAFADRELVGFSVTSTDPACNSVIFTQPTDFVVNVTDPVNPGTLQGSDFTVNGTPANTVNYTPGTTTMTFHFNSSPVVTQGVQTMHIPAGAFNRASDNQANLEFTCTFRYDVLLLQVVSTVPPVGGTFSPPAPNDYQYDVNFNEPVDPASVQISDLTVTGNSGPSVTAVSVINGNMTARFTLHMNFGGALTATIAAGAITDQFGNLGAAFSGNYTVEGSTCAWSAGPDMPSVGTRLVGVYFPANGKFYAMGGRSSDLAGSDFTHPFEYDPGTNTWTTKAATYPDNQVNNMACGVLDDSGTDYIYCVGGSAAGQTTATARVFRYNPVTDAITTFTAADSWPGDVTGTILPGGFAVTDNKLYILGGFDINVASTNQIWQFDPAAAIGSKWTQKVNTPEGIMYAPACSIGGIIYVGGASDFSGGLVIDTTNSFSFNPGANTIGTIAPIPRATGETRALNFNGQMLVMGGGRVAPNPSNEVDVYDPGTNTWSTSVPPFTTARRNFPTDTDGTSRIWLAGGYDSTSVPVSSMEIFECTTTGDLTLTSAVSRKHHGNAGTFDIDLPLAGTPGVEDRVGKRYDIVLTFSEPVTSVDNVETSCGEVRDATINGTQVRVTLEALARHCDTQEITVTLTGVNGDSGTLDSATVTFGLLIGDANADRRVSRADLNLVNSQRGQEVTEANFREDVTADGIINRDDTTAVRAARGTKLP